MLLLDKSYLNYLKGITQLYSHMANKRKSDSAEVEEDFLEVDTPIPGQNYTCLSFVSPEKELARKDLFVMHSFLKEIAPDFNLDLGQLTEKYDDYVYQSRDKLEKEFTEKNDFRTSVRGVKVRGCYESLREAQVRAKVLQRKDPSFHVFVGQIGYWLPWDPCADDVEDQEYTEGHLNKLVKKYKENQKKKDVFWDQQKNESLKKIEEETQAKKKKLEDADGDEDTQKTAESTSEVDNEQTVPTSDFTEMDPWMKRKMEEQNNSDTTPEDGGENQNPKILDLDT